MFNTSYSVIDYDHEHRDLRHVIQLLYLIN